MKKLLSKFFILFLLVFQIAMHAREPYEALITVANRTANVFAPNMVDLTRDLRQATIEELLPIYTPTSRVFIDYNLRGIIAFTAFEKNSTVLTVFIPQAGILETFDGGTREQSLVLFKDSVKEGGSRHRLLKAYAKYSPIDPMAGNPNSLMAQMAHADYALGHLSPLSGCDCCCWSAQPILHQFQAGAVIGRAFSNGFETTIVTAPLRYSYSPNREGAFIMDAPLTYYRNGGASSVFGSLAMALRFPITQNWSLTPVLRMGFGGSLDLCTAGNFVSMGATSVFNYKVSDFVLSLTNYAGYTTSTNLWLTGINFSYNLHNYIFRNGLSMTTCEPYELLQSPVNFSVAFVDTYFAKDELYLKHYDEVTFSMIMNYINPCIDYDSLSIGFTYQFGHKKYRGYYLNTIYQF